MVNIFGMDLDGAFDAIRGATSDLFQHLDTGGAGAQFQRLQGPKSDPFGQLGGGRDPFQGLRYGDDPFGKLGGTSDPFGDLTYGGGGGGPFGAFEAVSQRVRDRAQQAAAAAAQGQPQTTGSTVGGPSAGMSPGVAKWATKAQQTFGGLVDPDVMLAIMQNESGGDPGAKNPGYPAYGLFQLVGFGDGNPNWAADVDGQFAAARRLAEDKLRSINASYAAHGLNPDARTRARDFALAWAGHFDYDTAQPNPASRDRGSQQTAQQLSDIFLANYDRIKAGRQQASAPAGNVKVSAQGFAFPVAGWNQPVQLHWGEGEGGTDIMAAEGTPVVSMGAGTITDVSPNSLGGNTITMKLDNGLIVYMAHLRDAPLVAAGQRVAAGTALGYVGHTGNAANTPSHLHIGIGYGIQSGSGPQGGLGTGFNAVDWLNQILQQTSGAGGGGASYN